jgi:hypothetical protein
MKLVLLACRVNRKMENEDGGVRGTARKVGLILPSMRWLDGEGEREDSKQGRSVEI